MSNPVTRGKFQVQSKAKVYWNSTAEVIRLGAVCDDSTEENRRFHKYTPTGSIEITVDNPAASESLKLGNFYYVDFIPVPSTAK